MTNELSTERAIEALYTVRAYYASLTAGYPKGKDCRGIGDVMCSEIANSCLMAIQALEQQPCEDYISRAEALHACCDEWNKDYKAIMKSIRQLPSVTPQPRWIPCSERLPQDEQKVLITTRSGNLIDVDTSIFYHASAFWEHYVIAWMPLPEPYKAESEGVCKDCYYNDGEVHAECVICNKTESGE